MHRCTPAFLGAFPRLPASGRTPAPPSARPAPCPPVGTGACPAARVKPRLREWERHSGVRFGCTHHVCLVVACASIGRCAPLLPALGRRRLLGRRRWGRLRVNRDDVSGNGPGSGRWNLRGPLASMTDHLADHPTSARGRRPRASGTGLPVILTAATAAAALENAGRGGFIVRAPTKVTTYSVTVAISFVTASGGCHGAIGRRQGVDAGAVRAG